MDLSALKGMLGQPTLVDYMGKGKNGSGLFDSIAQDMNQKIALLQASIATAGTTEQGSTNVTLSEEAKKLIAESNGDDDGKLSGVQKGSQNFLMGFFDENGIEFDKLSDDAKKFLTGLQGVIAGSGATTRDYATDMAEGKYSNGLKEAYTLTGDQVRLRVAIEYTALGKPVKLSVTDIAGGGVETADITLQSEDGKVTSMTINRTQREYANGHMTKTATLDPLEIGLYDA